MIYILMGVSGCGKSTIGHLLSAQLGFPFFDGDDFHPPENIAKMSGGIPLTDEDRLGWIEAIAAGLNSRPEVNLLLACSALSANIRAKLGNALRDSLQFIFLKGTAELIAARLQKRSGHYMPPGLLASQFSALQEPGPEAWQFDIHRPPEDICREIVKQIMSDIT